MLIPTQIAVLQKEVLIIADELYQGQISEQELERAKATDAYLPERYGANQSLLAEFCTRTFVEVSAAIGMANDNSVWVFQVYGFRYTKAGEILFTI